MQSDTVFVLCWKRYTQNRNRHNTHIHFVAKYLCDTVMYNKIKNEWNSTKASPYQMLYHWLYRSIPMEPKRSHFSRCYKILILICTNTEIRICTSLVIHSFFQIKICSALDFINGQFHLYNLSLLVKLRSFSLTSKSLQKGSHHPEY